MGRFPSLKLSRLFRSEIQDAVASGRNEADQVLLGLSGLSAGDPFASAIDRPAPGLGIGLESGRSLHRCEVVPQVLQTVRATEQGGEVGGVDERDVARPLTGGRHPDQRVELGVAFRGEGVGSVRVDALTRQDPQLVTFGRRQFVVRQVGVEVERGDVVEQSRRVEIGKAGDGRDLLGALDNGGSQTLNVVHGHIECLHQ
jgi:hypothetical protein